MMIITSFVYLVIYVLVKLLVNAQVNRMFKHWNGVVDLLNVRSIDLIYKKSNFMIIVDLHDGADGRPVVRHAFTFIKDAYLGEILLQIKEFAFYASP